MQPPPTMSRITFRLLSLHVALDTRRSIARRGLIPAHIKGHELRSIQIFERISSPTRASRFPSRPRCEWSLKCSSGLGLTSVRQPSYRRVS